MRALTIADVAREAGVSIKTVSRVLNKEPHVREDTRQRVLDVVSALGFRPNISARALAGARTFLIALYFNNPSLGYVSSIQAGALKACRRWGRHLLVEDMSDHADALAREVESLHGAVRVDGVVLTPPLCDELDALDALDRLGIPYVRIAPTLELDRSLAVSIDDRLAAEQMTVRLVELGHRRIAFIAGPGEHRAASLRRQGFIDGLLGAGADRGLAVIETGAFSIDSGAAAAERLLARPDRPTAIFCANDDMALGALAAAHRAGVSVPEELSIVGFDDNPASSVVWPPLTTVRQPMAAMADAAIDLLLRAQQGGETPASLILPFEVVMRGSATAPTA